jgi:hypothetical protein
MLSLESRSFGNILCYLIFYDFFQRVNVRCFGSGSKLRLVPWILIQNHDQKREKAHIKKINLHF